MNKYIDYLHELKERRVFPKRETGPICKTCFYHTSEIRIEEDKKEIFNRIKSRIGTFVKCRNTKKEKVQYDYCKLYVIK